MALHVCLHPTPLREGEVVWGRGPTLSGGGIALLANHGGHQVSFWGACSSNISHNAIQDLLATWQDSSTRTGDHWAVYSQCDAWGAPKDQIWSSKSPRVQPWDSHHWHHDLVQLHSSCKFRQCGSLACLLIPRQSVKVHSHQANLFCSTSSRVHTQGRYHPWLSQAATTNSAILAIRHHPRFLYKDVQD